MEYDLVRVRQRIQYIETCITRLVTLIGLTKEEFLSDFRNIESAKHLLQVAIEAMMDIGSHILARRRVSTPQEGSEIFRKMGENELLPTEKVLVYVQMVIFRNMLVHLYQEINNVRGYDSLDTGLDDMRGFIEEAWNIVK